jgi:hypothetical protein
MAGITSSGPDQGRDPVGVEFIWTRGERLGAELVFVRQRVSITVLRHIQSSGSGDRGPVGSSSSSFSSILVSSPLFGVSSVPLVTSHLSCASVIQSGSWL